MSSLQIPILSSSSSSQNRVHAYAAIGLPKLPRVRISLPKIPKSSNIKLVHGSNNAFLHSITPPEKHVITTSQTFQDSSDPNKCKDIIQLNAILKAVADRVEMHKNICAQRNNWNSLLLMKSIDMMMVGLKTAIHDAAFKLTSTVLFTAAKGILLACAMKRVLAPNKAYTLHLLGTILENFPSKFENQMKVLKSQKKETNNNGWSPELEQEMREVIELVKRKDNEDYERLGNLALKINKTLAILGPLFALIAALGSAFARHGSSWAGTVAVMAGSLADSINAVEHGGQVGMVFEMHRKCGGSLKDRIEATLEEKNCDKRENGELFEMKVAKKLGKSVSQLRKLASISARKELELPWINFQASSSKGRLVLSLY